MKLNVLENSTSSYAPPLELMAPLLSSKNRSIHCIRYFLIYFQLVLVTSVHPNVLRKLMDTQRLSSQVGRQASYAERGSTPTGEC
jgi:hypothetical protein